MFLGFLLPGTDLYRMNLKFPGNLTQGLTLFERFQCDFGLFGPSKSTRLFFDILAVFGS
jgi:hypothetical protein